MFDRIPPLEAMLAADPGDTLTHFLLGREYLHAKRFDDAARVFRRCTELDPDYTAAWRNLGDALRFAERTEEAIAAYREGIVVSERTGDLQVKKECTAFLNRLTK